MPDIPTLFPEYNTAPPPIRHIYRENYHRVLAKEPCKYCGFTGDFSLFDKPFEGGKHTGLKCRACGKEHPLWPRVQWLASIAKVMP